MNWSLATAITSVLVAMVSAFAEPARQFVADNPAVAALLGALATVIAAAQKSFLNKDR